MGANLQPACHPPYVQMARSVGHSTQMTNLGNTFLFPLLGLINTPVLKSLAMGIQQLNNDDSEFHALNTTPLLRNKNAFVAPKNHESKKKYFFTNDLIPLA